MAARLHRTIIEAGLWDRDATRLLRCHDHVMQARRIAFPHPRHPDLLHPGRTALILLEDVGVIDADAIAAGILHDSRRPDLQLAPETVHELAGARVVALTAQFPAHDADELEIREALVIAEPAACLAALAEQLDHARHLHLAPRDEWAAVFARTLAFQPVALRAHPKLGRRYARWTAMFARRYLNR